MYKFEYNGTWYEFTQKGIATVANVHALHKKGLTSAQIESLYGWTDAPGIVEMMIELAEHTGLLDVVKSLDA